MLEVDRAFDFEHLAVAGRALVDTVLAYATSGAFLVELAAIAGTGLLAWWVGPHIVRFFLRQVPPTRPLLHGVVEVVASVAVPSLWLLLLQFATTAGRSAGLEMVLAGSSSALLVAWIVIRLLSHVVRSAVWSRIIFVAAWSIAALEILGLLGQIRASLASVGFSYGDVRITALNIVRALIALAILLWLTAMLRGFLERRISHARNLTPTLQVLLVQVLKILLPTLAFLAVLPLLGINLTALTVFGGALAGC